MSGAGRPAFLGEKSPQEAFDILSEEPSSALVDVRTHAELAFVGGPDLSGLGKAALHVELRSYPQGRDNPDFAAALTDLVEQTGCETILFLCRSGVRSLSAAMAAEGLPLDKPLKLYNVSEGFEGDLDAEGRRGRLAGWKVRGLPWRQS